MDKTALIDNWNIETSYVMSINGIKQSMKQSKFKSKPNKDKDKTIIGDEWSGEDNPEYSCSWCNRTLSKLIDSSGENPLLYPLSYSFRTFRDPDKKKSKLGTQREEVEPAVTSIQTDPSKEVEIRHTGPLRGGFEALSKKGLRFTSYSTTEKE